MQRMIDLYEAKINYEKKTFYSWDVSESILYYAKLEQIGTV